MDAYTKLSASFFVNKKGLRQKLFDDEGVKDSAYWVVIKSLSIVSSIGCLFACLLSQLAGIITRIPHSYLEPCML